MDAEQWKKKIVAIIRAFDGGDDKPLGILCENLAVMSDLCDPKPTTETINNETPIVDESPAVIDSPVDDADEQHSED